MLIRAFALALAGALFCQAGGNDGLLVWRNKSSRALTLQAQVIQQNEGREIGHLVVIPNPDMDMGKSFLLASHTNRSMTKNLGILTSYNIKAGSVKNPSPLYVAFLTGASLDYGQKFKITDKEDKTNGYLIWLNAPEDGTVDIISQETLGNPSFRITTNNLKQVDENNQNLILEFEDLPKETKE